MSDNLDSRTDTPQAVAIACLIDLAQNALDEGIRLDAARILLDR